MPMHPLISHARFTPLLTTLALLAACSDDSVGGLTESTQTTGIDPTDAPTTTAVPTTTTVDPSEATVDPSNPDSSVSHGSSSGSGTATGDGSSTTTADVTATTTDAGTTTTDAGTTTTGDGTTTTGDGTTGCDTDGQLCAIPPEEQVPTPKPDGLPGPLPGVYDDLGTAPEDDQVRALIGFPTRDRAQLEARVVDLYDPQDPGFRKYMTLPEWMTDHAPSQDDFDLIAEWLVSRGMTVNFAASNRLLVQFSGSVKDFNATFATTLNICMRKNPQQGLPPFPVYCTLGSFTLPKFVAERTTGLLTADLPADVGALPAEAGAVVNSPPGLGAYSPAQIAVAYEIDDIYAAGFKGEGIKIGIVAASTYHTKDLQSFWKSFGITRALPTVKDLMEPTISRVTETMLDTEWSSSMAPGADIIVYQGPDARNTALVYAFNEAIALAEVDVITDSFAHREDSEPLPVRHQYDESALMAAALGITVVSASGDSARPDTPCSSPYVTCVGGTTLTTDAVGNVLTETAWSSSGSGDAKSFNTPAWQVGVVPGNKRALVDVACNASPSSGYWVRRFGAWQVYGGTSFSAPVFAGLVAVVNSYRKSKGLPRVGFLNPSLYTSPAVRASFRDVIAGGTDQFNAKPGWDYPTGWGAPRAKLLADALP